MVLLALPFPLVQPLGISSAIGVGNCCDDKAIAGHDIATPGAERKPFWLKRLPVVGSLRRYRAGASSDNPIYLAGHERARSNSFIQCGSAP